MALTQPQRSKVYGTPPNAGPRKTVTTPWGIKVVVHTLIADVFLAACREAHSTVTWRPQRIDSYNARPIRGSTKWSMHAYALAWDFFATPPSMPPPGGVWTPLNPVPPEFAACFTRRGFRWGATFKRVDLPHIEWPGPPPAATPPEQEDDEMNPRALARLAMRTFLGRNPNDPAELEAHAKRAAADEDAYCRDLADSAEGKAYEAQINAERAKPDP